jgi:hypothetical protein
LNLVVLDHLHTRVIKFDPFAFRTGKCVVVAEGDAAAHVNNNSGQIVYLGPL